MATNYLTDYGKGLVAGGSVGTGATLKLMLVTSAYTPAVTHQYVSSASSAEISTTNYTGGYGGGGRKTLSGLSVTVDTTNHRAYLTFSPATWTALGTTSGPTTAYAVLIIETGGSDSTALIVGVMDCANSCLGQDFTVSPSATGLVLIS